MQDGYILILSSNPTTAQALARGVERVLPCRILDPAQALPAGTVLALLLDVPLGDVAVLSGIRRTMSAVRARAIPCVYLARDTSHTILTRARTLGATRIVPLTASRQTILSALIAAIEASAQARRGHPRWRVQAQATEACWIITGVFDAAASDQPLSREEIETGTSLVLEAVSDAGIRAWLDVIWAHEAEVYQHSLSVAGYAATFGDTLGLRPDDKRRLARAALLHDVGKARIPLAILNKPGRLTPAETGVMQTHPAVGADLLAQQPGFDAESLDVVRHHHEMLDGSGYPDGLARSEVKDLVRLITICDIYSALTERRPYRAPMRPQEAWAVMDGMGGKLDADLLRAFRPVISRCANPSTIA
ncbi:hypothetical protein OPKNFCMD_1082 [Methylobacterium crusticola]|uniref:HD domain-containing protein n=1 Tax=Methylobacterium crusticola TaxID=1697972 RepID=A0ABQ4QUI2_9HYPH|nr:HD domain-containing phosphohydrolase [Methylobacterium crusticola]GJD48364.1 hypothetical protein OPKNFCMD_1082 [Methylobacterium crusticola]